MPGTGPRIVAMDQSDRTLMRALAIDMPGQNSETTVAEKVAARGVFGR